MTFEKLPDGDTCCKEKIKIVHFVVQITSKLIAYMHTNSIHYLTLHLRSESTFMALIQTLFLLFLLFLPQ